MGRVKISGVWVEIPDAAVAWKHSAATSPGSYWIYTKERAEELAAGHPELVEWVQTSVAEDPAERWHWTMRVTFGFALSSVLQVVVLTAGWIREGLDPRVVMVSAIVSAALAIVFAVLTVGRWIVTAIVDLADSLDDDQEEVGPIE